MQIFHLAKSLKDSEFSSATLAKVLKEAVADLMDDFSNKTTRYAYTEYYNEVCLYRVLQQGMPI